MPEGGDDGGGACGEEGREETEGVVGGGDVLLAGTASHHYDELRADLGREGVLEVVFVGRFILFEMNKGVETILSS